MENQMDSWNALMIACEDQPEAIKYILSSPLCTKEVLLQKTNTYGVNSLMIACVSHPEAVKCIISFTSKFPEEEIKDIFFQKTLKFKIDALPLSLNSINKNDIEKGGQTYLHILAIFNPLILSKDIKFFSELKDIKDNSGRYFYEYLFFTCEELIPSLTDLTENKVNELNLKNPYIKNVECSICLVKQPTHVFTPCGHASCSTCGHEIMKRNKTCHMCKCKVTSSIKIIFN
jgi:hypothetical protein